MSNFLNLRCPKCGDEDRIDILAEMWVRVTDDGTDADASTDGSTDYTPKSLSYCGACGHCAPLFQFDTEEEEVQS